MSRWFMLILVGGLICLSLVLGFFQESIKVDINYKIQKASLIDQYDQLSASQREVELARFKQDKSYDFYASHADLKFLLAYSRGGLIKLKWILTVLFVLAHLLIGLALVGLLSPGLLKAFLGLYVVGFLLAACIYFVGKLISLEVYPLSRRIIGFLQSILPIAVLYLGTLILQSNEHTSK